MASGQYKKVEIIFALNNMKHIKRMNENNKTYSSWEISSKIDKILSNNIKEIPWEGKEVDTYGIKQSFLELIWELAPEYKPKDY